MWLTIIYNIILYVKKIITFDNHCVLLADQLELGNADWHNQLSAEILANCFGLNTLWNFNKEIIIFSSRLLFSKLSADDDHLNDTYPYSQFYAILRHIPNFYCQCRRPWLVLILKSSDSQQGRSWTLECSKSL